jgi:threonine dehydratase
VSIKDFYLSDIFSARHRISQLAVKTPLVGSTALSKACGASIALKLENLQPIGAFKLRGAANKILSLTGQERSRGVLTVSSGNHGRAVSYVASSLGVKATICLPRTVPENKREAIRSLGAELRIVGDDYDAAMEVADSFQAETNMTMVHAFDDLKVIAGQGTIGLEIIEELPDLDTVIVPLSGGGLISGIAFSLKQISPDIHVVGVSMDRGAAMVESLKAGRVVEIIEEPTLADALAGGLNKDNRYTLPMVQKYVDETVLVTEDEIAQGVLHCLVEEHLVVEGGAAVGVSALLANKIKKPGKNAAVVISGGNISPHVLSEILTKGDKKR